MKCVSEKLIPPELLNLRDWISVLVPGSCLCPNVYRRSHCECDARKGTSSNHCAETAEQASLGRWRKAAGLAVHLPICLHTRWDLYGGRIYGISAGNIDYIGKRWALPSQQLSLLICLVWVPRACYALVFSLPGTQAHLFEMPLN